MSSSRVSPSGDVTPTNTTPNPSVEELPPGVDHEHAALQEAVNQIELLMVMNESLASQIERIAGELETLKRKVDRMERSSERWATDAPNSTTTKNSDNREGGLGPLAIDHSGLLDDPLELRALNDLEALLCKKVEIMASSHSDYSTKGVKILDRHITQISIKRCDLTTIPESIRHLKRLEWLGLEGNKLTTLPDIFGELPSLKDVDLRYNPLEALPPSLQHMTRPINVKLDAPNSTTTKNSDNREGGLGPLAIDHSGLLDDPLELRALNDLEALLCKQVEIMASSHSSYSTKGVKIRNRHITQISIKRCDLTTIPESIRHLKHLEWLGLEGNKLTTLPDIFGELPSLKVVDLRYNPLEALPPSLQHMTRPINVKLE